MTPFFLLVIASLLAFLLRMLLRVRHLEHHLMVFEGRARRYADDAYQTSRTLSDMTARMRYFRTYMQWYRERSMRERALLAKAGIPFPEDQPIDSSEWER